MTPLLPTSTLFPYTTLFRSKRTSAVVPGIRLFSRAIRLRGPVWNEKTGFLGGTVVHRPVSLSVVISAPSIFARKATRSEEHTSELQSRRDLVCRLLLEKKKI